MGAPEWSLPPVPDFDWAVSGGAGSSDLDLPETSQQHREHVEHRIHQGMDILHTMELIHEWKHVFHALHAAGHTAEVGAGLAWPEVAAVGAAEVAGGAAVVVVTFAELFRAFRTVQRIEHQKGLAYGLMWESLGIEKDVERTTRMNAAGEVPMTESERQAWEKGIQEGRELADKTVMVGAKPVTVGGITTMQGGTPVKVRDVIAATMAYEMAKQGKDPLTDPHQKAWNVAVDNTLNRVWEQTRETSERWGERGVNRHRLDWIGSDNGFPRQAPKP